MDDYGRLDARPSFLKSMLFTTKQGITDKNINDAVNKLASVGLVDLYEIDGKPLLLFPKWGLHQRIRNSKEKYPAPDENGNSRKLAANCGELRPESNPNPNPNPNQNPKENTPARHKYGEFGWVLLTDAEHERLLRELGEAELNRCITYIDESAQGNGNKNEWKDWNLTIRKCHRDGWGMKQYGKPAVQKPASTTVGMPSQEEITDMKRYLERLKAEG